MHDVTTTQGLRPGIPETLEEALSPEWLTAALRTRFPDVQVEEVTPGPVVSRVSTNARFRIHSAKPLPEGLSPDLCVKGYYGAQRESGTAGVSEALFYKQLADSVGVRTLRGAYADVDPETGRNVLITEDVVAQGGSFLDPLSEYSVDQLAESLEQLATLHAATWMSPSVAGEAWLKPWLPRLGEGRGVDVIRRNFSGPIGAGVPERVRDADRLFNTYTKVAADAASASPWSVIHGDAHVGNLFLDGKGRPSFLDWQIVQRGPWYIDVGYHLASTLAVPVRRSAERDLIRHYLDRLSAGGVDAPGEDAAWRDLRWGMVHGFYLWGITQKVAPPITTEMETRLGTAVDDHDAFGVVERS